MTLNVQVFQGRWVGRPSSAGLPVVVGSLGRSPCLSLPSTRLPDCLSSARRWNCLVGKGLDWPGKGTEGLSNASI